MVRLRSQAKVKLPKSVPASVSQSCSAELAEPQSSDTCEVDYYQTIGQILMNSQKSKEEHTLLLTNFKEFYYSVKKNQNEAFNHQGHCASMLWRLMYGIFNAERNQYTENGVQFFVKIITSVGLESDQEDFKFPFRKTPPMYAFILKFFIQCHSDIRIIIRQRLMEMLKITLEAFHKHPAFKQHKNAILEVLIHRNKDKHYTVRIQTLRCMSYYGDNSEVRKALRFAARKDPNPEVRRTSLKILTDSSLLKPSIIYEQAFDPSELVRIEAFKILVNIPLHSLSNVVHRRKLISWGLTYGSKKIQEIVKKELIPAWLSYSNNSLVQLLSKLELSTKPYIASLILNHVYKNNDEETLSEIDLSFLSEKKLIQICDLGVEKVQYWYLLCLKFQDLQVCSDKLLPDAIEYCNYILEIVKTIHKNHEAVIKEDAEEEYNLFICLAIILRISEFITFEEGSRREMREVVKQVILDPILADCIIVNAGVDISFNLLSKEEFNALMNEAFRFVFQDIYAARDLLNTSDIINNTKEQQAEDLRDGEVLDKNGNIPDNEISMASPKDTSIANGRKSFIPPFVTSTPFVNPAIARATYIYEQLRQEQGTKTLAKLRLGDSLEKAIELHDLIEAKHLREMYRQVCEEEKELLVRLEQARHASELGFITAQGTAAERFTPPEPVFVVPAFQGTPICSPHNSSITTEASIKVVGDLDRTNGPHVFKGITLLLRYLMLIRKRSPEIEIIIEDIVFHYLNDQDGRIRAKILNVVCVNTMLDTTQTRSSMIILCKAAMLEDDKTARAAGFNGMVDLLIEYNATCFLPKLDDEIAIEDCQPIPEIMNNPEADPEELREMFTTLVVSYGGESPEVRDISIRVVGTIKLLLRGRITSVDVIANLLCLWVNPNYAISEVCYDISCWLPIYVSVVLENSYRLGKALIISLRKIFDKQEANEQSLKDSEYLKLIDFVLTSISPKMIKKFRDYQTVHEKFALEILGEINSNIAQKGNTELALILTELTIETAEGAIEIRNMCARTLENLTDLLTTTGIPKLVTALKAMIRELEKNFNFDGEEGVDVDTLAEDFERMNSRQKGK